MLSKEILIEKMKLHFPRWMDIRKRVDQSRGGLLLTSMAEEISSISEAISDFKKDFFIDGYFGREESIVDILYKVNVGSYTTLALTNPAFNITDDIQEFFDGTGLAYVHNGCLYIKKSETSSAEIGYKLNGIAFSETMSEFHVWNAFDEFAAFVGLVRHQGENNADLEKRILNVYGGYVDSTEDGMKNAIINELLAFDQTITADSIQIEAPSPDNLLEYYDEFTTVLDCMENVNQDTYKSKKWDKSLWTHSMARIDYMPHAWDAAIESYQNGIGFGDDLKVEIVDPNAPTNVDINLYIKDQLTVMEHFKSSDATVDIPVTLRQYNDVVEGQKCSYQITASQAYDITDAGVYVEYYKQYRDCISHKLCDLVKDSRDMSITADNRILEADKGYSLTFSPDADGIFEVSQADLTENGITTNLIGGLSQSNTDFKILGGKLVGSGYEALLTKTYNFTNFSGAENTKDGIAVADSDGYTARLECDISGLGSKKIYFSYSYPEASLLDQHMTSEAVEGGTLWTISGQFSKLALKASGTNFTIKPVINEIEGNLQMCSSATDYASKVFYIPVQMTVEIKDFAGDLVISNAKYASFSFRTTCSYGSIANNTLPDFASNKLTIVMSSNEKLTPVLKNVYIGTKTLSTYTMDIASSESERSIEIDTRCIVSKSEIVGETITPIDQNFKTSVTYTALTDDAYVQLLEDEESPLTEIIGIASSRISEMNGIKFLLFDKNESMSELTAMANINASLYSRQLTEIVDAAPEDRIYITYPEDGIVVDNGISQTIVVLTKDVVGLADDTQCRITGIDKSLVYAYKVNDGYVDNVQFDFDCLCVKPRGEEAEKTSKAMFDYNIISPAACSVSMRNFFSPKIDMLANLYFYSVTYSTPGTTVMFGGNSWHVGAINATVKSDSDFASQIAYTDTKMTITENFEDSDVAFLDPIYVINGQRMDMTRNMVLTDEGFTLHYREASAHASLEEAVQSESEFYFVSSVIVTEDGFSKLKHSNIDQILYTGSVEWSGDESVSEDMLYTLHSEEGIIEWTNPKALAEQTVYIMYSIKIPDYIEVDVQKLYESSGYTMNAYKFMGKINYTSVHSGTSIDLNGIKEFKMADKVLIECSEPGFQAHIDNGIATIKCLTTEPKVAVKTGYYYDDGQEYYLFNNYDKDANKVENSSYYDLQNVDVVNGQMKFYEQSTNFVRNSAMTPEYLFNTVNINFSKSFVKTINNLNHITACNSLNYWNTVGQTMQLATGYNDVGIEFKNMIVDGYSYIDITDFCIGSVNNIISLYARGDSFSVYLGESDMYNAPAELIKKFSVYADDFYLANWTPEPGKVYCLIVKGACVIDDIIISESLNNDTHTKNVDKFGLATAEYDVAGYTYGITPDAIGARLDGVTIKNSKIEKAPVTSLTAMLYSASTKQEYMKCAISNLIIDNNVISTDGEARGTITTPPIYIKDRGNVDHLAVYINNVMFSSMKNIPVTIYGTDSITDSYAKLGESTSNSITIKDNMKQYLQLRLTLPAGKVINDIKVFAVYKEEATLPTQMTYTSKVYDAQYKANYSLNSISVPVVSNTNDVEMFIRAAKEQPSYEDMFTDWKQIAVDGSGDLAETIEFESTRFFQLKVKLKNAQAYVKINNISLELM